MDTEESSPEENVKEKESEVKESAKRIHDVLFEDFSWEKENSGLVGFRNLGDTCYMNSTLQCLVHCPPLVGLFCSSEFDVDRPGKAPLVHDFSKLLRNVWQGNRRVLAPQDILRDVMKLNDVFLGYQQQDAQELLLCILGNLDDMTQRVLPLPPTKKDLKILAKFEEQERKEQEGKDQEMESLVIGATVTIVTEVNEKGRYGVKLNKVGKCISLRAQNLVPEDVENCKEDEDMEEEENKKKEKPKKLSRPPPRKAFRSPITDIFSGCLRNETECLECGHVSKVLNNFQDLSLPIPGSEMVDRTVEERKATPPPRQGLFGSLLTAVGLTNSQTTLDICLHSFCTSEELIDSEKYHCEKCKRKVNAKKVMSIALLPDVLVLHIKRFNYHAGFWGGSKKTTLVDFEATMDMRSYLHPDFVDHDQNENSEFELYGLVRHNGSLSGGHYVAYCRRPDDAEKWYCFDDRSVYDIPLSKVLQKEAYLLFYCRRTKSDSIRQQVWNVLDKNLNDCNYKDSPDDILISSYFFRKLKHYCHIGPLDNHRLLCPHGKILPVDDKRFVENSVRIPLKSWKALEHKFKSPEKGEIPIIKCIDKDRPKFDCIQCQSQQDYQSVSRYMSDKYKTENFYCIPSGWAEKWREFADPFPTPRVKPPGEIDNSILIDSEGNLLQDSDAYIPVNEYVWKYLIGVHGGGPEVLVPKRKREAQRRKESSEHEAENEEESGGT